MHRSDELLLWIYAQLLKLYPPRHRAEFGDEMRAVFEQAIGEARRRGRLAIAHLVWLELRDAPVALICAHLEERRKRKMETLTSVHTDDTRANWSETLAGIFPFLVLGPLTVLLAFPFPPPEWRMTAWGQTLMLLYPLPLLVGAIVGWLKGFPRWCYPYWGFGIIILGFGGMSRLSYILFSQDAQWQASISVSIGTAVVFTAVLVGLVLLISRLLPFLRQFYDGIRQDWTKLSFGFYSFAALMFGAIDHEEDPDLTFFVLTPSLMIVLGALAYLQSTTKSQRVLVLMLGLILAVTVRFVGGKGFYVLYGTLNALIVLIPALMEFLPYRAKSAPA